MSGDLGAPAEAPSQRRLDDLRPTLIAHAETVRRLLPEFDQVSIIVRDRTGTAVTCAQVGHLASDLDRLQYRLAEGPCLDGIRGDVRVVAPHIHRDDRWRRYASEAAQLGLRAQLTAPLARRGDGPMGALNLYSTTRGDIASPAPFIAEAVAVQVAGVLDSSREIENLHRALDERRTTGIAVGLLMAEHHLSEAAALAVLQRCSVDTDVRLGDLAARMVAEGNASQVMPTVRAPQREPRVPDRAPRDGSISLPQERATPHPANAVAANLDDWFHLIYVDERGRTHEMTLQAPSDTEAVQLADEALDDLERIGIRDQLRADGLTVRPPARLHVKRVTRQAVSGFGLVITDPDGTVTRRQLDQGPPSPHARPFASPGGY